MPASLFPPEPAKIADVLVPVAVDTAYSYKIPRGMTLAPGDFVTVPLGPRETTGVVWEVREGGGDNLKTVKAKQDLPAVTAPLRQLIDWLARWTLAPRGMVLRMGIKAPENVGPEPVRIGLRRLGPPPARLTPARQRVLEALIGDHPMLKSTLAERAACSASVIDGLVDEGTLEALALPLGPVTLPPDPDFAIPVPSAGCTSTTPIRSRRRRWQARGVALVRTPLIAESLASGDLVEPFPTSWARNQRRREYRSTQAPERMPNRKRSDE